jgi:hypothetical protein
VSVDYLRRQAVLREQNPNCAQSFGLRGARNSFHLVSDGFSQSALPAIIRATTALDAASNSPTLTSSLTLSPQSRSCADVIRSPIVWVGGE